MAPYGLRDRDRLDGVSNFVIWKAKILTVLKEYSIRDHMKNVLVVPTNVNALNKFNENQAREKRLIMDGVKDHVVPHIFEKRTTHDMLKSLTTLYQGIFFQWKMLLENQMRMFQMHKGEEIDPFLFRLQTIRDQLISIRETLDKSSW